MSERSTNLSSFSHSCAGDRRGSVAGIAWHGAATPMTFSGWNDAGIGFWLSEDEAWAMGYAKSIARKKGAEPVVFPVRYALNNALELGDLDDAATDMSLRDLAGSSDEMFGLLAKLRLAVGYNGDELDAPCMFEVTNTPRFVAFAKSLGYDGMAGYEDAGRVRVICCFSKVKMLHAENVMPPCEGCKP